MPVACLIPGRAFYRQWPNETNQRDTVLFSFTRTYSHCTIFAPFSLLFDTHKELCYHVFIEIMEIVSILICYIENCPIYHSFVYRDVETSRPYKLGKVICKSLRMLTSLEQTNVSLPYGFINQCSKPGCAVEDPFVFPS